MKPDKKELQKQNYSYSEDDDSSSSDDDENAELLTEELEEGFYKVLSQLKKKDSKLYEESVQYYPTNSPETYESPSSKDEKQKKSLEDYREWLKGQKEKVENKGVKKELKALHDFWTSPSLNKDEQFLRDYILDKKFLNPDDNFNIEEEINKLSDEEREVEEQLQFEHKYNSRFENPIQEEAVKSKSKNKRRHNKDDENVPENDNSFNCDGSPSGKVESNVEETKLETKRKKKKHKQTLENKALEETEKDEKKIENVAKKQEDEDTVKSEPTKRGHNEDVCLEETPLTPEQKEKQQVKKSYKKRKRNNSLQSDSKNTTLNISSEVNTERPESSHLEKISKKKRTVEKLEVSGKNTKESKPIGFPGNEQKQINNLPRNLKMKNINGTKKPRYRNQNKTLWMKKKKKAKVQIEGNNKNKHQEVGDKINKKLRHRHCNGLNKPCGGKKQKHFKSKQTTHFQNLIVKEKKNKEFKIGKILSKKQKANKVSGKS